MRRLTFAPNGNRYKAGWQLFNAGPEPTVVVVKIYRNGKENQNGWLADERQFSLGVRSEVLFKLEDHFNLSEDYNYSIDFFATKEEGFSVYAYHVDPQSGLFYAPTQEVPTQPGN